MDVSKNTELQKLDCRKNKLLNLSVDNNTKLHELYCENNKLAFLDVSPLAGHWTKLSIGGNRLTSIVGLTDENTDDWFIESGTQTSTRRYYRVAVGSSEENCWALPFYGNYDASRVQNLKIDGEAATPVVNGNWLIVSQDLSKIPTKVEYDFKTFDGIDPMHVVVNYDVVSYGVSIDGTELTSLHMNNIPGLKSGKAYINDKNGQGGSLGWDKAPTLVLDNATLEWDINGYGYGLDNHDTGQEGLTIKVLGNCTIKTPNARAALKLAKAIEASS